jgi:hypothetical protein
MGSQKNDQKRIFEKNISKILPKNCYYLAKFCPKCKMQKSLMPTISKKWYPWLENFVPIQSLAL